MGGQRQGRTWKTLVDRPECRGPVHLRAPKRGSRSHCLNMHVPAISGGSAALRRPPVLPEKLAEGKVELTATDALVNGGGSTPFTAPTSADDVRAYVRNNNIEFLFAQFV